MKARRFAAIILAGGLSNRMKEFKPLLPLGEATVTDRIISTFLSAGVDVFLVTGYRHQDIETVIKKYNVTIIYNPDFAKGMFSSIQAGVRQLPPEYQAFFLNPVDIPLVRTATIQSMMAAAKENPGKIIYPTFNGKRGHPPLIPSSLIPAISGWDKNSGLKAVLKLHEQLAREVAVADNFILLDIDTPKDYHKLLKQYRE